MSCSSMCLFRGRRRRIRKIPRGTTQSDARGICCLRGMSQAGVYVNRNAIQKTKRLRTSYRIYYEIIQFFYKNLRDLSKAVFVMYRVEHSVFPWRSIQHSALMYMYIDRYMESKGIFSMCVWYDLWRVRFLIFSSLSLCICESVIENMFFVRTRHVYKKRFRCHCGLSTIGGYHSRSNNCSLITFRLWIIRRRVDSTY